MTPQVRHETFNSLNGKKLIHRHLSASEMKNTSYESAAEFIQNVLYDIISRVIDW